MSELLPVKVEKGPCIVAPHMDADDVASVFNGLRDYMDDEGMLKDVSIGVYQTSIYEGDVDHLEIAVHPWSTFKQWLREFEGNVTSLMAAMEDVGYTMSDNADELILSLMKADEWDDYAVYDCLDIVVSV